MSSPLVASVKPDGSAVSSSYRKIVLRRFALAGAILAFILLSLILDFIIGPSGLSLAAL